MFSRVFLIFLNSSSSLFYDNEMWAKEKGLGRYYKACKIKDKTGKRRQRKYFVYDTYTCLRNTFFIPFPSFSLELKVRLKAILRFVQRMRHLSSWKRKFKIFRVPFSPGFKQNVSFVKPRYTYIHTCKPTRICIHVLTHI